MLVLLLLSLHTGGANAQVAPDSGGGFRPIVDAAWVEVLLVAIGAAVDLDIVRKAAWEHASFRQALGARLGLSAGTDPSIYKKEPPLHDHSNFAYRDVDILLRYEITYSRLSIAFFSGYAWRNLGYFDDDHTGGRFKYGVELNDLFIPPVVSSRISIMAASFGKSYRGVEFGPFGFGLSLGWFNRTP